MPLTPAGGTPVLTANLVASAMIGTSVPQLAQGVATGISNWSVQAVGLAICTGTLGVGQGSGPLTVPPPPLLAALAAGFASQSILGVSSPLLINGLANGMSLFFSQGLLLGTISSVGAGAGVTTFPTSPPAAQAMIQGFASAGMTGSKSIKMAIAIGNAIDTVFSSLSLPIAVAGPPSIVPGAGSGVIKIV